MTRANSGGSSLSAASAGKMAERELIETLGEADRRHRAFIEGIGDAEYGRSDHGRIACDQTVEEGVELQDTQAEDHRPGLTHDAPHRGPRFAPVASPPRIPAQRDQRPAHLNESGDDDACRHHADVRSAVGFILGLEREAEADRADDNEQVQDHRRGGGRTESAVHLQHRAKDRHRAHHWHVRKHNHHQPDGEVAVPFEVRDHIERCFANQDEYAEQQCEHGDCQ